MTIDELEQVFRGAGYEIERKRLSPITMRWEVRLGHKVEGFRWNSANPEVVPEGFADAMLQFVNMGMGVRE